MRVDERKPKKGPLVSIQEKYRKSFLSWIDNSPLLRVTIAAGIGYRIWYVPHRTIANSKEVMEAQVMAKVRAWATPK